jgi:deazaflavin-dependent oxidoreductase (nitroreductase family)
MGMTTKEESLDWNRNVIAEFRGNGGVVSQPPFPVLLLTTVGGRSGRRRTTPLAYGVDGGRVFVVGSSAGAATDPAWLRNLQADPSVTVEMGTGSYQARAVLVNGAERDRLYASISARIGLLREYERATDRLFPVVVLDGVPAPDHAPK